MFEIDAQGNFSIKTSAVFENQEHVRKDSSHAAHAACIALILRGMAFRLKKATLLLKRGEVAKSQKMLETLRHQALKTYAQEPEIRNIDDIQHRILACDKA